jgi:hypothetical protein
MEQKQIFRKSAIDSVSSPEQLTDYIRVTTPGVWVILAASIILLGSLFAWAACGRVEANRTDANGGAYTETVSPLDLIFGK